jgi:hypothetical protein
MEVADLRRELDIDAGQLSRLLARMGPSVAPLAYSAVS